jgi:hypothetical protein
MKAVIDAWRAPRERKKPAVSWGDGGPVRTTYVFFSRDDDNAPPKAAACSRQREQYPFRIGCLSRDFRGNAAHFNSRFPFDGAGMRHARDALQSVGLPID